MPLLQRSAGKDAEERMKEKKYLKFGAALIVLHVQEETRTEVSLVDSTDLSEERRGDEVPVLLLTALYFLNQYIKMQKPRMVSVEWFQLNPLGD